MLVIDPLFLRLVSRKEKHKPLYVLLLIVLKIGV